MRKEISVMMAGSIHDAADGSMFMSYNLYRNLLDRGGFDTGVAKNEGWFTKKVPGSRFSQRIYFRNEAAKTMFLMKYR